MDTKNLVLALLEKNKGKSISGTEIAKNLNVSRNAVWKSINLLKKDGHIIQGVNNRGYILSGNSIIMSAGGIVSYLPDNFNANKIHVYNELESTNITAKEMAVNGFEHGTTVIANSQTNGKGRFNRPFYSPAGSGLYMSLIFRAKYINLNNITMITAAAATAVCKAIKTITGKVAGIKWVNDILLDNKKICGISTEAVTDFESGEIDWIVTGIGINVTTNSFPDEYKDIATSIFEDDAKLNVRNQLAAKIINSLTVSTDWINDETVYNEYKKRLVLLGKEVTVITFDETYQALVLDIDKECRLIVKKDDGSIIILNSGEISLKL